MKDHGWAWKVGMKLRFLKLWVATATSFFISVLWAIQAQAQTSDLIECAGRVVRSLDFANNTLQSGTTNAVGSVYRYSNVGDGVDAEVTILGFTGGGGITIIDRDTGLTNNFQPEFAASNASTARWHKHTYRN